VRADSVHPVTRDGVVLADPTRRTASGRRLWRVHDFIPALDELVAVYPHRDLVVKTAPGIDPAAVPWAHEVEVISLDGQVREACLWSAGLATTSRRATVLGSDGTEWTITDEQPDDVPVHGP